MKRNNDFIFRVTGNAAGEGQRRLITLTTPEEATRKKLRSETQRNETTKGARLSHFKHASNQCYYAL
jgi:hypothetical protein